MVGLAILVRFLSGMLFPEATSAAVGEHLKDLDGLDERVAHGLREFGIQSDRGLIHLSPRGQQELKSKLGMHTRESAGWRKQILDRWKGTYLSEQLQTVGDIYPDPELGGLYSKRPTRIDDFTQLSGIDRLTAHRLNFAGIYSFQQLRLLTAEQQANFKRRFNLSGLDFSEVPAGGVTAAALSAVSAVEAERFDSPSPPGATPSVPAVAGTTTGLTSETKLDPEIGEL